MDRRVETGIYKDYRRSIQRIQKDKEETRVKRLNELKDNVDIFINEAKSIGGIRIISREVEGADVDILRELLDGIKSKIDSAVVILGSKSSSRANLICGVTKDLVKKGIDASRLIKKIAEIIGGSGGGRPDLAQAGGKEPDRLTEALESAFKVMEEGIEK